MARRRDDGPRGRGQRGSGGSRHTAHDREHARGPAHHGASGGSSSGHRADDRLVRVAGLPSVAELFETGADRVERLYFQSALRPHVQDWCAMLARRRKVYRQVGDDEMRRVAGTAMHGGIVAIARLRPIRDLDLDAAERWAAAGDPLLVLDGVGNPQNIGAIVRTAAFFGVRRMVLSDQPGQAALSDTSYRVAKGGLEHVELYSVHQCPDALRRLAAFYHVVGTAVSRGTPLARLERGPKPIALVLGNEEDGLAPATLAACTSVVALGGTGRVQSLNVSAAAAILIHALLARA
jgi:TrmH RNA methyltransferase